MKNILKMLVPCVALVLAFSSCNSTMDDKADIDAKYATATTTVATLSEVTVVETAIDVKLNIVGTDVLEKGIEVASKEDFSDATAYPAEEGDAFRVEDLPELSTLYVRAYAVTKAAGTVVSAAKMIVTGEIPTYTVDGTYTCTEWEFNTDSGEYDYSDTYTVTISFAEPGSNDVLISGIWGYPGPVEGTYDPVKNVISVDSYSVIGTHSSYGQVWVRGVNDAISAYLPTVDFKFTPKGGAMVSSNFAVQVQAGTFGYFMLEMKHDK